MTHDSLIADSAGGKAVLHLTVDEGQPYQVGTFDIEGNRRFSTEELQALLSRSARSAPNGTPAGRAAPVQPRRTGTRPPRRSRTSTPTTATSTPRSSRPRPAAPAPDGKPVVDLRWTIREGSPATINKIEIVGNDVTHERVIREAIVLLPGDLFSRERLIRSYQNVSNLGFFQQPMPTPDVKPSANGVDVDIVFRVEEKRTGNINFGASLGQGTGVGGFLGLEEPNLFGRGKRGKLQWQFGKNINDFTLSYTDPAIRESRISGHGLAVRLPRPLHRRRPRAGGSRPAAASSSASRSSGSRYTRVFTSYAYQRIRYCEGSADLRARFSCSACTRSSLGASVLRDTRIGLPFAIGGSLTNVSGELNGGFLGGTGNYQKVDLEGRWYAPLGTLGGGGQLGGGVQFVLGLTAKSGFIFGDAGPFFTELYSLGGVQYGIPLRGYDEFSITPNGFDPSASGNQASPDAFGKSYAAFTVEAGARISQSLYVSAFFDAGNVYRERAPVGPDPAVPRAPASARAVISPLGPIGIDLGYGFDRVDGAGPARPGLAAAFQAGQFLLARHRTFHREQRMKLSVRGNLGRLPRARLRGVAARGAAGRGGEDRLRQHPGDPQGDAGLRAGRVDLHQGARDLPGRGPEAPGQPRLRGLGLRAAVGAC